MSTDGQPEPETTEARADRDIAVDTLERRPFTAILLGLYWFLPAILTLILDFLVMVRVAHWILAGFCVAIGLGIFRGAKWAYWGSCVAFALFLGMSWLQWIHPGWATTNRSMAAAKLVIALAGTCYHWLPSIRRWFRVRAQAKFFWLLIGVCALAGQFLLPTLKWISGR